MPHLRITSPADATGDLRDAYRALGDRKLPEVYRPRHGSAPMIIQAHSLDPEGMRRAFRTARLLNGGGPLTWPEREMVNAGVSRLNQCFY